MADWKKIKTEYITTDTSYRKLAQKHGVNYRTICIRSQNEGWLEQRKQHINKVTTEAINTVAEKQIDHAARLQEVTEKLLVKIESMAESEEIFDAKSVRALCAAIKDIKDIQGIKSEADKREQEARIKRLQMETDPNRGAESPKLIIEGLPEEFKA